MGGMFGKRQFTLGYIFWEILACAVFFAAVRLIPMFHSSSYAYTQFWIFAVAAISGCTAIGGLLLRPVAGAIIGALIAGICGPLWFAVIRGIDV